MVVSIACDHGGFLLKTQLIERLKAMNYEVIDRGCFDESRVDYPTYAKFVCQDVVNKQVPFGILICTTGIGMSIYANKWRGIRAALVTNLESAHLTRQHNNSNIITMGARFTAINDAVAYVDAFVNETFEGGRHEKRVCMISDKENEQ
jgi:ribose 5-phosphate isomerase B